MAATGEIVLILHNLRSRHNVGAIFRVAEAAGVKKIYLTGYTPAPRDRFGRVSQAMTKISLGAENHVKWKSHGTMQTLLEKLSASGFQLLALEQSGNSINYRKIKIKGPTAVIVGNEVRGLNPAILKKCDQVVEIPMRGRKESLNVAVATGIFLFHLLR